MPDGVRVFTLDDAWGCFTAVEHWNAECVGWHVPARLGAGLRRSSPIAQGLRRIYGALDADSARGLALTERPRQRTCPTTFSARSGRGIRPSSGFVEEPETNGVAERWNRTLKEQAIHGRIFQNLTLPQ